MSNAQRTMVSTLLACAGTVLIAAAAAAPLLGWVKQVRRRRQRRLGGQHLLRRLADQLRRGYATASTNTGHEAAPGVTWPGSREKPERLIDFALPLAPRELGQGESDRAGVLRQGRRAGVFHRLLLGRLQGLMEAQRFPRLRRHRRRRASEQLDATDGRRFRRRSRCSRTRPPPAA